MDYNEKFISDLKMGELGEKTLSLHFRKMGYKTKKITGDYETLKKGDLIIENDRVNKKLEIKTDAWEYYKGRKTGNIAFEVSKINKYNEIEPSGVNITNADYFIYFFPMENIAYIFTIQQVRDILILGRRTLGGDRKASIIYLVKRDDIPNCVRRVIIDDDINIVKKHVESSKK